MTAVEKMHFVAPAVSTLGLAPCVQGAPDSHTHTHGGVDPRNEQVLFPDLSNYSKESYCRITLSQKFEKFGHFALFAIDLNEAR